MGPFSKVKIIRRIWKVGLGGLFNVPADEFWAVGLSKILKSLRALELLESCVSPTFVSDSDSWVWFSGDAFDVSSASWAGIILFDIVRLQSNKNESKLKHSICRYSSMTLPMSATKRRISEMRHSLWKVEWRFIRVHAQFQTTVDGITLLKTSRGRVTVHSR